MARWKRGDALVNPGTRERVLAACLELIDEMGRIPGLKLLAKRAGVGGVDALNIRASLVQEGLLPAASFSGDARYRQNLEDPTVEHPDAPDADEIQARIAEVRAEKEAAGRACNRFVMRARHHQADYCGRRRVSM